LAQLRGPIENRAYRTGRRGGRRLITSGFWQDYFALHAGRYVWTHHELCGFRVSVLDQYTPQLVILAPAERQMLCAGQN